MHYNLFCPNEVFVRAKEVLSPDVSTNPCADKNMIQEESGEFDSLENKEVSW